MTRRRTLGRAGLWTPPLLYMAAIFYVSSIPEPAPQITAVVWDKLLHAAEYAGLAALFCRALIGERFARLNAVLAAIVLTVAYAASDEWHQSFVALRQSDVLDWTADFVGAAVGAVAYAKHRTRSAGL